MTEMYIYFIHDRTTETVKIGVSANPEQRIASLIAASPCDLAPLRYVAVAGNGYDTERFLHARFRHLNVRGEWFKATPELLDFARFAELPLPPPAPLAPESAATSFSIRELAEKSGVSERNLRFYIACGALPPPYGGGRGSRYGLAHLDQLRRIAQRQAEGWTLEDIAAEMKSRSEPEVNVRVDLVYRLTLEGVPGPQLFLDETVSQERREWLVGQFRTLARDILAKQNGDCDGQ